VLRALVLAALLLALANPSLVEEQRRPQQDVAVVVVDESASQQSIGDRSARTAAAVEELRERLSELPDLEVRVVLAGSQRLGTPVDAVRDGGTRLFRAIDEALADVPRARHAGTILVTDGQVHDVPTTVGDEDDPPPLHALLTGHPDEGDRRLAIVQAPTYGIVGHEVEVKLRIDDLPAPPDGGVTPVRLSVH